MLSNVERIEKSVSRINTVYLREVFFFIFTQISFSKIQESSTTEKEHPNLYHPTYANPQREQFMDDYSRYGFTFIIKRYFGYTRWLDLKIRLKRLLNKII